MIVENKAKLASASDGSLDRVFLAFTSLDSRCAHHLAKII